MLQCHASPAWPVLQLQPARDLQLAEHIKLATIRQFNIIVQRRASLTA